MSNRFIKTVQNIEGQSEPAVRGVIIPESVSILRLTSVRNVHTTYLGHVLYYMQACNAYTSLAAISRDWAWHCLTIVTSTVVVYQNMKCGTWEVWRNHTSEHIHTEHKFNTSDGGAIRFLLEYSIQYGVINGVNYDITRTKEQFTFEGLLNFIRRRRDEGGGARSRGKVRIHKKFWNLSSKQLPNRFQQCMEEVHAWCVVHAYTPGHSLHRKLLFLNLCSWFNCRSVIRLHQHCNTLQ